MSPIRHSLAALLACAILTLSATQDAAREKRLEWFREAKYGMFIHWGLYAIPAGDWHGTRSLGLGEWIMNRSQVPVKEYEQLADPVQSGQVQSRRVGPDRPGRGDEIHRHHLEAP